MGIRFRSLLAFLWRVKLPLPQEVETPEEKEENERMKADVRARQERISKQLIELTRTMYWRGDR